MDKYNTLGCRIKSRRQALNLSQSDLSKQLNCTQAALSQYENGNREPGVQDLINIANMLGTTTDYLLGNTDIPCKDANVKMIGDYLGLNEESISKLHELYWERKQKTLHDYLQKDMEFFSDASPGDDKYDIEYNYLLRYNILRLEDYLKIINDFICSPEFDIFVSCLTNNLHIERTVYDLLRIVAGQYSSIQSPFYESNVAKIAYGLAEDAEDDLREYSLNLFDTQTALIDFCKGRTQLEDIKKLDYSESFYRKLHYLIYHYTRPMFENNNYSIEALECGLSSDDFEIMPQVFKLLGISKPKAD